MLVGFVVLSPSRLSPSWVADGETKGVAGGGVVHAVLHFVFLPGWVVRLASSPVMVTESKENIV